MKWLAAFCFLVAAHRTHASSRSPVPSLPPPEMFAFDGTPEGMTVALEAFVSSKPRDKLTVDMLAGLSQELLTSENQIRRIVSRLHRVDVKFPQDPLSFVSFYNTKKRFGHVLLELQV